MCRSHLQPDPQNSHFLSPKVRLAFTWCLLMKFKYHFLHTLADGASALQVSCFSASSQPFSGMVIARNLLYGSLLHSVEAKIGSGVFFKRVLNFFIFFFAFLNCVQSLLYLEHYTYFFSLLLSYFILRKYAPVFLCLFFHILLPSFVLVVCSQHH